MVNVGIDLSGTNIKVGIVNEKQEIVAKGSTPTIATRPAEEIVADMAGLVLKLLKEHDLRIEEVNNIGIGCPGTIDSKHGIVAYSNNIPWNQVPLADMMKEKLGVDVKIHNDADCAALGEAVAGAAKGCSDMILLTLGTGVGGGIIINGKIFDGYYAGGAEIGHTTLISGGQLCTCGRKGCLEAYASATGLIRMAKEAMEKNKSSILHQCEKIDGAAIFHAAQEGDDLANEIVDQYIQYLSEGIINCVNIFRPEKILLGGGISHAGDRLIKPINAYIKDRCFGGDKAVVPEVSRMKLGNDAGIIGAANL